MHRLSTPAGEYLCGAPPAARSGGPVEPALAGVVAAAGEAPPHILYWDAEAGSDGPVRWGRGGLDARLAAARDLTGCAAVSTAAIQRLVDRGALADATDLGRALALLARSPTVRYCYLEDLVGVVDPQASGPSPSQGSAGAVAERLTLAVMLTADGPGPQAFLDALGDQTLSGRCELILAALALSASDYQAAAQAGEQLAARDSRFRVRRYAFDDATPLPFAANAVMALSTTDAVVFADPAVRPVSPGLVQTLADWTLSADVAAATPALEHDGRLAGAGLSLTGPGPGQAVAVGRQHAFSDAVRLAAAPMPWIFAANRRQWMAAGGAPPWSQGPLWTAFFASREGPAGRSLYVGDVRAAWTGDADPGAAGPAPVTGLVHPGASRALLAGEETSGKPLPPLKSLPAQAPQPAASPLPRTADRPGATAAPPFHIDPPSADADLRVLVFADDFGPSQAIAFEHGLAESRRAGRVAVCLVREADFPGDGRSLNDPPADLAVQAAFRAARPDLVVVSRLGHGGVWRAVHAAARGAEAPVVFHIDDDLFDLPANIGIERYRLGRAPRRLATLQSCLDLADLTLTTTPALAERLARYAGHRRIQVMHNGCAGAPLPGRRGPGDPGRVRIGYMGSASHNADLAMVAPALNRIADAYPQVEVELFGSISRQPAAAEVTAPGARHPGVVGDYGRFCSRLAELGWDIGLAPLRTNAFNSLKTPTKWAEYASAGIAVVASRLGPYESIITAGAALAADDRSWEWRLRRLIEDPDARNSLVVSADRLLLAQYSWEALGRSMEAVFRSARARSRALA